MSYKYEEKWESSYFPESELFQHLESLSSYGKQLIHTTLGYELGLATSVVSVMCVAQMQ